MKSTGAAVGLIGSLVAAVELYVLQMRAERSGVTASRSRSNEQMVSKGPIIMAGTTSVLRDRRQLKALPLIHGKPGSTNKKGAGFRPLFIC